MFVRSLRQRIELLLEEGLTPAEIAHELRVAGPTVDYHVARLRQARTEARATPPRPAPNARSHVTTRRAVAALLAQGLCRSDIAKRLGVSKATISYHARRLGAPVDSRCARRYDWTEIQRYYDEGHSVTECQARFGFARASWSEARRRGAIVARPIKRPIETYLVIGRRTSRHHLKMRLLDEGLKRPACEQCGLTEWLDRPIPLALHHVNGDGLDNRLENLQLLCGNCHGLTENFGVKNWRRRRLERAIHFGKLKPLSTAVRGIWLGPRRVSSPSR